MTWNYRIVRDVITAGGEEQEFFTIREIYYNDAGEIESWTANACAAQGDTWQECADDLSVMGRALGQPVVDVSSGEAAEITPTGGQLWKRRD